MYFFPQNDKKFKYIDLRTRREEREENYSDYQRGIIDTGFWISIFGDSRREQCY